MDQAIYSALENAGAITVAVRKSPGSLGGSVNYSTADGTARAGTAQAGNYQATFGALNFAAGDTVKTVAIPIFNVPIYTGNLTFNFALGVSGDGSVGGDAGGAPASRLLTLTSLRRRTRLPLNIFPGAPAAERGIPDRGDGAAGSAGAMAAGVGGNVA